VGGRELTQAVSDMLRGRVYRARLAHIGEDKFFLVVSNNRRNRAFEQVLAARLTTTPPKTKRPALVPLGPGEIFTGWVSCDDIETLYEDEVRADLGAVTAATMRRVEAGLHAAFDMAE
jgi:mRNA interferase MazF